jgi:tetratricopeptide (TPR) repeat protein
VHAKLAEALAEQPGASPEQVAFQFAAAGQHVAASTWYLRGAERAATDLLFDVAQKNAELADGELAAAGLSDASAERARAAVAIGRAMIGGELYEDAVKFIEPRLALASGPESIDLHHLAGRAAARLPDQSRHQAAADHLKAALASHSDKNDQLKADILTDLVYVHDALGNRTASQSSFRHAWKVAHEANLPSAMVRLRRLTCIFWQPEKVRETIEDAINIARKHGLLYEGALCENNLGSAFLALHDLDRALEHYTRADDTLKKLGGYRRDTPVNNTGVVHLARGRLDLARDAFCVADVLSLDPHSRLFIRSNIAVVDALEAKVPAAVERLQRLVLEADASGDLFYRDCLRHNLGVALLEAGEPERAIEVATACPPHLTGTDDLLVQAKRARLLIAAHEAADRDVPPSLRKEAALLDVTTKPQAWLYRMPWYHNDIEFWED